MHDGNDAIAMSNQETVSIGCKFTELYGIVLKRIEHVRLSHNV